MSSILADQLRPRMWAPMRGRREVWGSQPMSTAVLRSPNKLWRSNSIFNLCVAERTKQEVGISRSYFISPPPPPSFSSGNYYPKWPIPFWNKKNPTNTPSLVGKVYCTRQLHVIALHPWTWDCIQRKTWCMGPYAGVDYYSPCLVVNFLVSYPTPTIKGKEVEVRRSLLMVC